MNERRCMVCNLLAVPNGDRWRHKKLDVYDHDAKIDTQRVRTGELVGLLPSMRQCERGVKVVHAAENTRFSTIHGEIIYPETIALCGVEGWGAGPQVHLVNCKRCMTTQRWKEQAS